MRIVAGRFKGRPLIAPKSRDIRPTSDRLREAMFDILSHRFPEALDGARVLDLFAGTGALGLEALSRGAATALFVDSGAEARALIRGNVEALACGGVTRIFRADASRLGKAPMGSPFGLVFLDPPYGLGLTNPTLKALVAGRWLAEGATIVVEEGAKAELMAPSALTRLDERLYGDTKITLFVHEFVAEATGESP
jgi:16S rRNA (guanine966-N2)-methyltransferase